jgi:hypothetical protein
VIVSPRSTASSRSEKCREASVAVMVFMWPSLSDNQIRDYGPAVHGFAEVAAGDQRPGRPREVSSPLESSDETA